MAAHSANVQLEACISADLHAQLKRAAELQRRTMTDFVVAAVIRLSVANQERFAQASLVPALSNAPLRVSASCLHALNEPGIV